MEKTVNGLAPVIDPSARVAENAVLVGGVTLEAKVSIWYGAVLRADEAAIQIGCGSNVQDNVVVHTEETLPVLIGREVSVGHGAILHGCTIGDRCIIGMGAILLNGCVIGEDCLVAAGAVVTQHKRIPPGSMVMGVPAKAVRPLTQEERDELAASAQEYLVLSAGQLPSHSEKSGI